VRGDWTLSHYTCLIILRRLPGAAAAARAVRRARCRLPVWCRPFL